MSTDSKKIELPSSLTFDGRTFWFPWVKFVPRPNGEDQQKIEDAIRENGVYPPLCWKDVDGAICVINGHTRLFLADKLGITKIPEPAWFEGTRDEAEIAAVAENSICRTMDWEIRQGIIAERFKAKWSMRKIARSIGMSLTVVQNDLKRMGFVKDEKPAATPEAAPPADAQEAGASGEWQEDAESNPDIDSNEGGVPPAPAANPGPSTASAPKKRGPKKAGEVSPAQMRQKMIDLAKKGIQGVTKGLSYLKVYDECDAAVRLIMKVADACDKGLK